MNKRPFAIREQQKGLNVCACVCVSHTHPSPPPPLIDSDELCSDIQWTGYFSCECILFQDSISNGPKLCWKLQMVLKTLTAQTVWAPRLNAHKFHPTPVVRPAHSFPMLHFDACRPVAIISVCSMFYLLCVLCVSGWWSRPWTHSFVPAVAGCTYIDYIGLFPFQRAIERMRRGERRCVGFNANTKHTTMCLCARCAGLLLTHSCHMAVA